MKKISLIVQWILMITVVIIFLFVALPKIFFPYEANGMEGSLLDPIARIFDGLPIYTKPSIHYIPWLYQPLYYYVTAAITALTGLTFPFARLTSILATIGLSSILFIIVRKETGKISFAMAGPALFLAAYGKTDYCLVMVRIDPLFTFLLVASVITVFASKSNFSIIIGALLFALCFFTKQTGLLFLPSLILYLWYARGWRTMLLFFSSVLVIIIVISLIHNVYYNGWYLYYTFFIPQAKGKTLRWEYAIQGLIRYIILRCWLVTTALAIYSFVPSYSQNKNRNKAVVCFGFFFLNSVVAGFIGILNSGGEHNVLLPIAAACGLFLPVMISEFSKEKKYEKLFQWAIPFQLAFLLSSPWRETFVQTNTIAKKRHEEFYRFATSLPGTIWVPSHGYARKYFPNERYAVIDQFGDALMVGGNIANQLQYEIDTAFKNKHWDWIVSDYYWAFPNYQYVGAIPNPYKVETGDSILSYLYKPK